MSLSSVRKNINALPLIQPIKIVNVLSPGKRQSLQRKITITVTTVGQVAMLKLLNEREKLLLEKQLLRHLTLVKNVFLN